jgi:fumarylacetoacetate (FAA) hydrolase
MKLATYHDGSRDGQLVVVSRDLRLAHYASGIAGRLQQVLDDWNFLAPQLEDLAQTLNHGKARHAFAFDPQRCMAPLPRAYQWADGSAYLPHVELVRKTCGAALPEDWPTEPLVCQGASDALLGPRDAIVCPDPDDGIDFGAQVAAITGDIARGTGADAALEGIRLLTLANSVSLRNRMAGELAKGFGCLQSRPATAFSPVAATPDELGSAWRHGRVHLKVESVWNGRRVGLVDAGPEMRFHFGELVAHLAKTRDVRAGSIVGSGTVSHRDRTLGYSCIAEKRALEANESGSPKTGFMQHGDTIRIEMKGDAGASVFGAIEQAVVATDADR